MSDEPRAFGAYRLHEPIGRGGMATVWLATREGSNDICVLKRLRRDRELDADVPARFVREAHVCTMLDHPNIARVVDAGRVDDDFFIAFEYVSGISVAEVLKKLRPKRQVLPFEVTLAIARQLLDGLAHAHACRDPDGTPLGIVHRDLSPANVMLGFDGLVKIIDFGVASARVDELRTSPGKVFGTMRYMSPDQALGQPLDGRSDLYTVGVVLHEMLSGAPVIERRRDLDWKTVLREVVGTVPPPLTERAPLLAPGVAAVVERAYAKATDRRWSSAREMRDALNAASTSLGLVDPDGLARFLQAHFEDERLEDEARFLQVNLRAGTGAVQDFAGSVTRTAMIGALGDGATQTVTPRMIELEAPFDPHVETRTEAPRSTDTETARSPLVDAPETTEPQARPEAAFTRAPPRRSRVPWAAFGVFAVSVAMLTVVGARRWFADPLPIAIVAEATPEPEVKAIAREDSKREPSVEGRPATSPTERIDTVTLDATEARTRAGAARQSTTANTGTRGERGEPGRSDAEAAGRDRSASDPSAPSDLDRLLADLRADPRAPELQTRLYERIVAAAKLLPDEARRQRAISAAGRARRSGSLRAFEEAVAIVRAP